MPVAALQPYRQAAMRAHEGGYYIRLSVFDRPGAFAAIAQRMAERSISLESIVQRRRAPKAAAPKKAAAAKAEANGAPAAAKPALKLNPNATSFSFSPSAAEFVTGLAGESLRHRAVRHPYLQALADDLSAAGVIPKKLDVSATFDTRFASIYAP